MRKIIITISILVIVCMLQAMKSKTGINPPCSTTESSYTFNNVHAYGDQLLNVQEYNSVVDMLARGFLANVSIKANTGCTYSWNKNYTEKDVINNTVNNVPIPYGSEYTVTLKVESQCIYDSFLGRSVKFVWTKSIASNNFNASTELGYPTKVDCATIKSSADRHELLVRYAEDDRIASSTLRLQ